MLMDIAATIDAEPDHSQSGSDENYQSFPIVLSVLRKGKIKYESNSL